MLAASTRQWHATMTGMIIHLTSACADAGGFNEGMQCRRSWLPCSAAVNPTCRAALRMRLYAKSRAGLSCSASQQCCSHAALGISRCDSNRWSRGKAGPAACGRCLSNSCRHSSTSSCSCTVGGRLQTCSMLGLLASQPSSSAAPGQVAEISSSRSVVDWRRCW